MSTDRTLTPAQAAHKLGVSRSKISRMLKNAELHGIRDNRGRWRIRESDLPERAENTPAQRANNDQTEQTVLLARLEERLHAAERRALELERERDQWREHARELAASRWRWPWQRERAKMEASYDPKLISFGAEDSRGRQVFYAGTPVPELFTSEGDPDRVAQILHTHIPGLPAEKRSAWFTAARKAILAARHRSSGKE